MSRTDEIIICNVNDREAPRYVISRMLTRAGFRVIEANNGEEALTLARRELPTAMILDLKLPDIDGMEVCRRLKADPATASIAVGCGPACGPEVASPSYSDPTNPGTRVPAFAPEPVSSQEAWPVKTRSACTGLHR